MNWSNVIRDEVLCYRYQSGFSDAVVETTISSQLSQAIELSSFTLPLIKFIQWFPKLLIMSRE